MAPWNRLRSDRSGDKDKEKEEKKEEKARKRMSIVSRPQSQHQTKPNSRPQSQHKADSSNEVPPVPTVTKPEELAPLATRRTRRQRDSVVSLSAVNIGSPKMADDGPATLTPTAAEPSKEGKAVVRPQRFSLLRFRHASDSQLSKTAMFHEEAPPVPPTPPAIITTAPTFDNAEPHKRRSTLSIARRSRAAPKQRPQTEPQDDRNEQTTPVPDKVSKEAASQATTQSQPEPPPYGDEANSTLALPVSRVSESSRSDGSSGEPRVYAQTTTTHTVSTTTTFFRLPRRKKDKGPLFPLPPKTNSNLSSLTNTPRASSARSSESPVRKSLTEARTSGRQSPARTAAMRRGDSRASGNSQSDHARPTTLDQRGRSSTLNSLRRKMTEDEPLPTPPLPLSTRTSTSTTGRPSLGGLFGANRMKADSALGLRGLRNNGDPGTPASMDSKPSFQLPREPAVVIPERQEGDTPAKYLARLEEVVNASALVAVLSKSDDEFMKNVLRSYMRRFKFFEDPLDMAIRKMLMHVELPKETQQIDRTLQSFADRYHECNPGIFATADDAYFVAFSILILHTDAFNKNNKRKMSKPDYVKNAQSRGGIAPEVLECFYDNILYTTFIHLEDDVHISGDTMSTPKPTKKGSEKKGTHRKGLQSSPVDPYTLILESKLGTLRPNLNEMLVMEDSFNFMVPNSTLNISELNKSFFRSGVIQIVSARSRPAAYANQATIANPLEASVGIIDIQVTKVGLLWRKDPKKKKTRSPWQEWGAVLTGSQLYFFRNNSWVKNLMHQYDNFYKGGNVQGPVTFKPPLENFRPDASVKLDDAVALVDSRYKKHKNALFLTRQETFAEVLLADNEVEHRDWLAKINYAAAFRSSGVRMRGSLGAHEVRKSADAARALSNVSHESNAKSENQSRPSTLPEDLSEEQQIILARRQIMAQKIQEADARIRGVEKAIETLLRNGRHLQILTPIQHRTRDEVVLGAMNVSEALQSTQVAKWRMRCYRKILALDLEDDLDIESEQDHSVETGSKEVSPQTTRESEKARIPFTRLGSKHSGSTGHSKPRPSNLATGQKLFSMDEIFRTPSRIRAHGKGPKATWELPPINFDRRKSTSQTRGPKEASKESADNAVDDVEKASMTTGSTAPEGLRRRSSDIGPRPQDIEKKEREILVQSGVDPDKLAASPIQDKDTKTKGEGDEGLHPNSVEDKDARAKARHSFQRKLQSGQSHQRSKKGKDSGSTLGATEDGALATESERLTRTGGSFTVHGKKASVVTFGAEWQNMSPEERLRRKRPPTETDRSEAGDSIDTGDSPVDNDSGEIRSPISVLTDIVSAPSFQSARSSLERQRSLSEEELSPRSAIAAARANAEKDEPDEDESVPNGKHEEKEEAANVSSKSSLDGETPLKESATEAEGKNGAAT